jgi:class 3 adenylate cyclase/putative methionine-R-sulfoxide reductase with GAF domain
MRGRSKAGSVKSRRRKPAGKKHPSVTARHRPSSAASQESKAARLELAAMSEILRLIAKSPSNVKAVLQSVAEQAAQICQAQYADIFVVENDNLCTVAYVGEISRTFSFPLDRTSVTGRSIIDRRPVSVDDLQNASDEFARGRDLAHRDGHRSTLAVPLIRESQAVGTICVRRTEVRPFERRHIDLLINFAAQAVIAIENPRLLNELRQRTADLSESLEHQAATSEVLDLISRTHTDVQPVFNAIAKSAARLCGGLFGVVWRYDGKLLHCAANHNFTHDVLDQIFKSYPKPPDRSLAAGRAILDGKIIHVPDMLADREYAHDFALAGNWRATLSVPMLHEGNAVGAIGIGKAETGPFSERQIQLLTNFAAQAVIAIENARLLDDLNKLNQQLEQRVSDQVGEIERMSRLRRFLPPQVADLIVASGAETQLESHRREITALFCDLRGFTGFSESSDPEDVMALLRDYHEAIGRIVIKYGDTLERFAGDGVMVIFNEPVPVENPALQAVLLAVEMWDAIGALTETWHRWGHDIGFGIGIAHGFATLGTIGFEGRFDYAAIGTVSNVASRLCDEAKPGQILISPRVLTQVEIAVMVEPVGEFALKGIRRPMTAYNVLKFSPSKSN